MDSNRALRAVNNSVRRRLSAQITIAGVLSLTFLLTACAPETTTEQPDQNGASSGTETAAAQRDIFALPLMRYLIAGKDLVEVMQIESTAVRSCLASQGVTQLLPEPDFANMSDTTVNDRLGYDLNNPPPPFTELLSGTDVLSAAFFLAGGAKGSEQANQEQQALESCLAAEENPVRGARSFIIALMPDMSLAKRLFSESVDAAESDAQVADAIIKWNQCMQQASYDMPAAASDEAKQAQLPLWQGASNEEIDRVTKDGARCASQAKLVDTRFAVVTKIQNDLISKNAAALDEERAQRDLIVQRKDDAIAQPK